MNKLYTLGYSGWSPEQIKATVQELGAMLIDIRYTPWSPTMCWQEDALRRFLGANYVWLQHLGNPNHNNGMPMTLRDPVVGARIVGKMLERRPVILMCGCTAAPECHRTLAADYMIKHLGAQVTHLYPPLTLAAPGKIKVLTLWEPWATLMALELKHWETRRHTISWRNYRGPLAIHAALTKEGFKEPLPPDVAKALAEHGYVQPDDFPRGKILALGELTECQATEDVYWDLDDFEVAAGDYSEGRLGLHIEHIRRLATPIKETGHQGLWEHPLEPLIAALEAPIATT